VTFIIEEVAMPPKDKRSRSKYPFSDMRPGSDDSFFVKVEDEKQFLETRNRLGGAAHYQKVGLCIRRVEGGMRVWRTK
jgi:hypothetical protein